MDIKDDFAVSITLQCYRLFLLFNGLRINLINISKHAFFTASPISMLFLNNTYFYYFAQFNVIFKIVFSTMTEKLIKRCLKNYHRGSYHSNYTSHLIIRSYKYRLKVNFFVSKNNKSDLQLLNINISFTF